MKPGDSQFGKKRNAKITLATADIYPSKIYGFGSGPPGAAWVQFFIGVQNTEVTPLHTPALLWPFFIKFFASKFAVCGPPFFPKNKVALPVLALLPILIVILPDSNFSRRPKKVRSDMAAADISGPETQRSFLLKESAKKNHAPQSKKRRAGTRRAENARFTTWSFVPTTQRTIGCWHFRVFFHEVRSAAE